MVEHLANVLQQLRTGGHASLFCSVWSHERWSVGKTAAFEKL